MCLYPRLIKNRKYTSNKKNGGNIPSVPDERVLLVPVGCGNCIECRKQKARGWQLRMTEEVKENKNGKFITLTFNNESILELSKELKGLSGYELDNKTAKLGVRRFLENWRKEFKTSVKHWLVTELGHKGTENIHLHGIIWTNESIETIRRKWKYGWIYPRNEKENKVNYVNAKTVNYIIKYITKRDDKHKTYKSIILTSPGIGSKYTNSINAKNNKFKGKETNQTYRTDTGYKMSLPIYWRNKIYSEEEREKLWLMRLDEQTQWIMGEKVDVSKGYEQADKLRRYYQAKNKMLGYGSEEKTEEWWELRKYENERRKLMQQKRMSDPFGTKAKRQEKHKIIIEMTGIEIIHEEKK